MGKKSFFFVLILFLSTLASGCSTTSKYCPPNDLDNYLNQSDTVAGNLQEYIDQGMNYPEQKEKITEQIKNLLSEFEKSDPPKCARKYKELVIDAMNTSITSYTLENNQFYNRSELAQFAYEKWNLVSYEKNRLTQKYEK